MAGKRFVWVIFSLASVMAAEAADAADWPQWLGPTRNGVTSEIVAPWTDDNSPKTVWRREIAHGYSSPIVADGVVYVHSPVAGTEEEQVQAFDAETGNPIWSDSYPRVRFRSMFGVGPRTTPSISDGRLYTYGITGILSCYDAKSGKRLWQQNAYEMLKGSMPRFGVCSSPVIVDGRVIVLVGGGGSAVAGFDAVSGELEWKVFDEPASSASPIALVRGEGADQQTDVVVQTTLRVMGLSPKDGSLRLGAPARVSTLGCLADSLGGWQVAYLHHPGYWHTCTRIFTWKRREQTQFAVVETRGNELLLNGYHRSKRFGACRDQCA